MTSELGSIISRLQGLKNVSGRRVMPGQEPYGMLESEGMDVSGTQNQTPAIDAPTYQMSRPNEPEPELGGELTSQSYDVRANTVNPNPQPKNDDSFLQKLGSGLASLFKSDQVQKTPWPEQYQNVVAQPQVPPPQETALPQEMAAPEEESGILARLGEWIAPKPSLSPQATVQTVQNQGETFTPAPEFFNHFPEAVQNSPQLQQQFAQKQELDQERIRQAQENPMQMVAYGATDAFANSPELIEQFRQYTGLDFTEQEKELTERYEKVLSDIENGYNESQGMYDEQSERLRQRILSNSTTEADKFYVGLALLMPLLVGGFFGKEAGIGALAGGAEGLAQALNQRSKNVREDESLLLDVNKLRAGNTQKKSELDLERLKIPGYVQGMRPEDPNQDLTGMTIKSFVDPETGNMVAEGAELLPGLVMDPAYANNPEKRKEMRKEAVELGRESASLERANQATANIVEAAKQLDNPGLVGQLLSLAYSDDSYAKKIAKQNSPMITIDGRPQNALVYLDSQIEMQKDAYRRNEGMKAFTGTISEHLGSMVQNPAYSGLRYEDLIDQVMTLNQRAQNFFVDRAVAQGFLAEPLVQKLGAFNRGIYKDLNRKEEVKDLDREKKLMQKDV